MIEPTGPLPISKYHQVNLELREQLQEGQHGPGLPGEIDLAQQFGVGRVTVRRALDQLAEEGWVLREPGKRTRPAPQMPSVGTEDFDSEAAGDFAPRGFLGSLVDAARHTSVKVLDWQIVPASPDMAHALRIAPATPLRKAVRCRHIKEGPVSHITTHVPEALVQGFGRRELARKPMLQLLKEAGLEPGRAVQRVAARQADTRIAHELDVPVGAALLWVRRLVFDGQDKPMQLLQGLYRPDRYAYQMEWSQIGALDAHIIAREVF